MLTGLALALALQGASAGERTIGSSDALRSFARTLEKSPATSDDVRFRLTFPIISDRKTDIAALQSPAGWSYDRRTGILTIDVDFGAVTPLNYDGFDKQGLAKEPPLRTLYFDTRFGRDTTFREVTDERGEVSDTQGWRNVTESYGLAIPTSATAYGTRGGDLPADFVLPFVMKMRVPDVNAAGAFVRTLQMRFEGRLRTLGGQPIFCGRDKGGAYAVDEFTQKTPNVIISHACFLPATLDSVSLVRTGGGPPLKTWVRGDAAPTPETPQTAVIMAGDRKLAQSDILQPVVSSSPNAAFAPAEATHGAPPSASADAPASPKAAEPR